MNKFSNLLLRALTALVGATVIIFCTLYDPWAFFVLITAIGIFTIREYNRLVALPSNLSGWVYLVGILTYVLFFLIASGQVSFKYSVVLIPALSIGLIIQIYREDERPLRTIALTYLGFGYVILPYGMLSFIAYLNGSYHPYLIVALFCMVWCLDTGAYFAGLAFGKHKLFERISPKKTWEGAIGGIVLTLICSWVFSLYVSELSTWNWIVVGIVIGVSGIFGDLVESFIKRVAMTKDSGTSIPGHGGFMDRFDSLIFAIPFYLLLLQILSGNF